MRVSGVRKSWLMPASISVRCATKRRMRSCMRLKACAAWRTSLAPSGFIGPMSRPRPKASAAPARRRIARTWFFMNSAAIRNSSTADPTSQIMNR
jgi:hypothetical protein